MKDSLQAFLEKLKAEDEKDQIKLETYQKGSPDTKFIPSNLSTARKSHIELIGKQLESSPFGKYLELIEAMNKLIEDWKVIEEKHKGGSSPRIMRRSSRRGSLRGTPVASPRRSQGSRDSGSPRAVLRSRTPSESGSERSGSGSETSSQRRRRSRLELEEAQRQEDGVRSCPACTFFNPSDNDSCEMCGTALT